MSDLLIRRAEIRDGVVMDVRVSQGCVAAIGRSLPGRSGETKIDAEGGALLSGLHDHHIHLFALAAAQASVKCGPPDVCDPQGLSRALSRAPTSGDWLRGVGYHESVAGDLDRWRLDSLHESDVPMRIQHRSGALWVLNSAAIRALDLAGRQLPSGVERNALGKITGRIFYEDGWLRECIGSPSFPDLSRVGRELASCGVTAVTDATPEKGSEEYKALSDAIDKGELRQRVIAMGSLEGVPPTGARLEIGPLKVMLRESALPNFDDLVATIRRAHDAQRCVAFHCVTRAELVMAATALLAAGVRRGDRIEHASLAPPELVDLLAELKVWVVTQPGFIYERGDVYAREVVSADRPWLYRGRGFLERGVELWAGTDAPYGDLDPWLAIRAAVHRRTREGRLLGESEALSPERALALFASHSGSPEETSPALAVGKPADLYLVDLPWRLFRDQLTREHGVLTLCRGTLSWQRGSCPAR